MSLVGGLIVKKLRNYYAMKNQSWISIALLFFIGIFLFPAKRDISFAFGLPDLSLAPVFKEYAEEIKTGKHR